MTTIASKPTGQTGELIIDDTSGYISFKVKNTGSATWISGAKWSGKVNGQSVSGTYNISGAQTVTVGKWKVSTDQTVSFTIADTKTSGLAGPTTVTASVYRASAPGAPGKPVVSGIGQTVCDLAWAAAASNGSAIQNYAYQVASDTAFTKMYASGDTGTSRSAHVTGLKPAGKFYARVFARNGVGRSPASPLTSFIMDPEAVPVTVGTVGPTSMPVSWVKGDNGSQLSGYDLRWDSDPNFGSPITKSFSSSTLAYKITGLSPGRDYYVQVRTKTTAGVASAWSQRKTGHTIPAIRVSNGSSWQWREVLVSTGTAWERRELVVSDGTNWLVPA